jgi:amino acid transporter
MSNLSSVKPKFGTAPVFFTAISTILGAIMFLRFGYAVGNVGFLGTLAIIGFAHLVTIPTGMAIAEIATNERVRGGGEYYIISRSFGINIGAAIGIALFLSQAISVAFYLIAFAEAFDPVFDWVNSSFGWNLHDKRIISLPAIILLSILLLIKGANMGMNALYVVVGVLGLSLISFFIGSPTDAMGDSAFSWFNNVDNPENFFTVFAIVFPAFTGMTAGVGLSGDLKDPKRSIPIGTMMATLSGMIVYVFIAYKLTSSATPMELYTDPLVMGKISIWGPIIPIGLAAATISSAIGSILVAPRTLQAIASDKILPIQSLTNWLSAGKGINKEPFNATLITSAIAIIIISVGNVNMVAKVISMFFMVTYGAICLISFLNHFAADPAYRPAFKSRWYISLLGFLMTIFLMFRMDPAYAIMSIISMVAIYIFISRTRPDKEGVSTIFQGVIFQISRALQIFLQDAEKDSDNWRPSFICLSRDFFSRPAAFEMMRWISFRSGFATCIYYIEGYLSKETNRQSQEAMNRFIKLGGIHRSNVYLDTMISPSFTSAVAQAIQLPSVSGKDTNAIMFEFSREDPQYIDEILQTIPLVKSTEFDICLLATSERGYGAMHSIHIWLTPEDLNNGSLMILLGYVIMGHKDWKSAEIKITAVVPEKQIDDYEKKLKREVKEGRLPISQRNIELIERKPEVDMKEIICHRSKDDDLIMIGFQYERLKKLGNEMFQGYKELGNIMFVSASRANQVTIENEDSESESDTPNPEEVPVVT